jgi:hypothetical protein
MTKTKRNKYGGQHGNSSGYLIGRMKRDRPDIARAYIDGKYKTVKDAAIDAGILPSKPHNDDKRLFDLMQAWIKADETDRAIFLYMLEDEDFLKADCKQVYQRFMPEQDIPELEFLIDALGTIQAVSDVIGTTTRTIRRWRAGSAAPPRAKMDLLCEHAIKQGFDPNKVTV